MDPGTIYRRLGELVVCFQWLENEVLQIVWLLLDPDRKNDPRKQTAGLKFWQIRKLVIEQFVAYVDAHEIADAANRKERFLKLIDECKDIADERNRIIHSTFIDLNAGGELMGILRSKSKTGVDSKGNEVLVFDQEHLNDNSFDSAMKRIADVGFELGIVYRQLIAWHGNVRPKASGTKQ